MKPSECIAAQAQEIAQLKAERDSLLDDRTRMESALRQVRKEADSLRPLAEAMDRAFLEVTENSSVEVLRRVAGVIQARLDEEQNDD